MLTIPEIWLKWQTDVDGGHIALFISVYLVMAILNSVGTGGYVWCVTFCNALTVTYRGQGNSDSDLTLHSAKISLHFAQDCDEVGREMLGSSYHFR